MPKPAPAAHPTDASRSRLSEERVAALLDIATEVFMERGFEAASVGEMARRAMASKGTFYSRYPSKEQLFEAVVRRRSDTAFGTFAAALDADGDPEEVLQRFAAEFLTFVLSPEAVSLLQILYMESRHFPELAHIFYRLGFERVVGQLAAYLRETARRGIFRIAHVEIAAEQFIDGLSGELVRRRALGLPMSQSREDRNIRIHSAVGLLLAAYRVEKSSTKI